MDEQRTRGTPDLESAQTEHAAPLTPEARAAAVALADADAPRLAHGDRVGRLTVLENLGEGGFGIVLAAYDPALDRKVALKVLRTNLFGAAHADGARARLLREARAMARLNHPNVVTVHDVGTVEGHVYIAMELVDGGTIGAWRAAEQPGWRRIVDAFIDAGRGLAAAHAAGLVHRDTKPDNILVGRDGRVRVTDFGIVSATGRMADGERDESPSAHPSLAGDTPLDATLTITGAVVGTPAYMAPEQHAGGTVDARSDQFNFAASLYHCLYDQLPFAGRSYAELAANTARGAVRPAPEDTDVPPWVHGILLRALARNPEDRYPSMEALLAALQRDPALARRRRLAFAGIAAVIAALVAALVLTLLGSGKSERSPCADVRAQLAGVWDEEIAGQTEMAFLATKRAHASDSYARVAERLDAYADEWTDLQEQSCLAAENAAGSADQLAPLRMVCLAQRLDDLAALTALFAAGPDVRVLDTALRSVAELKSVAACGRADSVPVVIPPPSDLRLGAEVEQQRRHLAKLRALGKAGKGAEGRELAESVLRQARALGYRPLLAEALLVAGDFVVGTGGPPAAEALFREAVEVADAVGYADVVAEGQLRRIYYLGELLGRPEEALALQKAAERAIHRAGDDPRLLTVLHRNIGVAYATLGQYEEARAAAERAIAIGKPISGMYDPGVDGAMNNLGEALVGLGRYEEARKHLEASLALKVRYLGSEHPWMAYTLGALGTLVAEQGKDAEALRYFERAIAIRENAVGVDDQLLSWLLRGAADCHAGLGDTAQAISRLERARELTSRNARADEAARVRFMLARLLWDDERGRSRALELAKQARDLYAEAGDRSAKDLAEVTAWLADSQR